MHNSRKGGGGVRDIVLSKAVEIGKRVGVVVERLIAVLEGSLQ